MTLLRPEIPVADAQNRQPAAFARFGQAAGRYGKKRTALAGRLCCVSKKEAGGGQGRFQGRSLWVY